MEAGDGDEGDADDRFEANCAVAGEALGTLAVTNLSCFGEVNVRTTIESLAAKLRPKSPHLLDTFPKRTSLLHPRTPEQHIHV